MPQDETFVKPLYATVQVVKGVPSVDSVDRLA